MITFAAKIRRLQKEVILFVYICVAVMSIIICFSFGNCNMLATARIFSLYVTCMERNLLNIKVRRLLRTLVFCIKILDLCQGINDPKSHISQRTVSKYCGTIYSYPPISNLSCKQHDLYLIIQSEGTCNCFHLVCLQICLAAVS